MLFRSMNASRWLPLALAILFSSTVRVLAQNETGQEPSVRQVDPDGGSSKERGKGKEKEGVLSEEEEKNLTPEQRLARNITSGAGSYCRFVGAMIPPKLMPGQQGTIRVAVAMLGAAVLPSPPPLELLSPPNMNKVSLGGLTVHPAEPGVLAAGYRGRPVYENTMILEVPATMGTEVKLGEKVSFSLDFRFDLYDGVSAQPIGRFVDHVVVEAEVGTSPDPAVPGLGTKPPAVAVTASETPVASAPVASNTSAPLAGQNPMPANAPPPSATESAPNTTSSSAPAVAPSTEDQDSGPPFVLFGVGGVVVLALVVLLARKK